MRLLSDKRAAATRDCRRRWRAGCVITLGCCFPEAALRLDEGRRDFMKRAFDAATRHQILMFTCHGEAWRDLGVAQRRIGDA